MRTEISRTVKYWRYCLQKGKERKGTAALRIDTNEQIRDFALLVTKQTVYAAEQLRSR